MSKITTNDMFTIVRLDIKDHAREIYDTRFPCLCYNCQAAVSTVLIQTKLLQHMLKLCKVCYYELRELLISVIID